MKRYYFVPLSFVLCTLVIVWSCPLPHQQKELSDDTQNSTTDEESIFQSPQKESREGLGSLNMGGYFSRIGHRARPSREETKQEIKQEGKDGSPRFEKELNKPENNEIEVDQQKKKLSTNEVLHHDEKESKMVKDEEETSQINTKPEEIIDQHVRRVRTPSVTDDLLEPEIIIEDDSDMAVDILREIPGMSFDPPERVAVLITGEPVIYHPQPPLPVEDDIIVEVDVEDDFDRRRKRAHKTFDENPEVKQTEPLEPRETVVNVGVKEHRKRSADETSRHGDSSSENVIKVRVGMYHQKKQKKKCKLSSSPAVVEPNLS